jgi:hypothetical protein
VFFSHFPLWPRVAPSVSGDSNSSGISRPCRPRISVDKMCAEPVSVNDGNKSMGKCCSIYGIFTYKTG